MLKTMFEIIATMADDPDGYTPRLVPRQVALRILVMTSV
jgi:hypothetical protein